MKQWHVFVNGDNFLLKSDNKIKKHGFYKWVRVDAISAKEAEERAVKKLRANTLLQRLTTNPRDNPPLLHVKEIWEIPNNKKIKDSGFVFYGRVDRRKDEGIYEVVHRRDADSSPASKKGKR